MVRWEKDEEEHEGREKGREGGREDCTYLWCKVADWPEWRACP